MFVIGSCRVLGACRILTTVTKESYMQCHYLKEIIQAIRYLNGDIKVPEDAFRHKAATREAFNTAQTLVIEVSSIKFIEHNEVYYNLLQRTSKMKVMLSSVDDLHLNILELFNIIQKIKPTAKVVLVGHAAPKTTSIWQRERIDEVLQSQPLFPYIIVASLYTEDTQCFTKDDFNHYNKQMFARLGWAIRTRIADSPDVLGYYD